MLSLLRRDFVNALLVRERLWCYSPCQVEVRSLSGLGRVLVVALLVRGRRLRLLSLLGSDSFALLVREGLGVCSPC